MKFLLLVVLVLAVGFSVVGRAEESVTVYASWSMSLDESGKVTALTMKPGRVKDALREQLEKSIRLWEFEPGSVNGVKAATETTLSVHLTITLATDGEGYSIVVDRAETGGAIGAKGAMPSISWAQAQGMKRDKKAKNLLVLLVTFDESGVPEEIGIAEGSPITRGPLVDDAIKAVRTWTFEPERIDGKGLRARALVPICYQVNSSDSSNAQCEWESPYGNKTVVGGESIALESSITLKSDVIGKTL